MTRDVTGNFLMLSACIQLTDEHQLFGGSLWLSFGSLLHSSKVYALLQGLKCGGRRKVMPRMIECLNSFYLEMVF